MSYAATIRSLKIILKKKLPWTIKYWSTKSVTISEPWLSLSLGERENDDVRAVNGPYADEVLDALAQTRVVPEDQKRLHQVDRAPRNHLGRDRKPNESKSFTEAVLLDIVGYNL